VKNLSETTKTCKKKAMHLSNKKERSQRQGEEKKKKDMKNENKKRSKTTCFYGSLTKSYFTYQVDDNEGGGRDEKSGPLEHVELSKVTIFIRGLGSHSEIGVNTSQHLQETLEDSKQVS
jgi:hypothetical protein